MALRIHGFKVSHRELFAQILSMPLALELILMQSFPKKS